MMVVAVMVLMPMMMVFMMPVTSACPHGVGHRREKDEPDAEQVYFFHLCLR
jgi:hypothetical protein